MGRSSTQGDQIQITETYFVLFWAQTNRRIPVLIQYSHKPEDLQFPSIEGQVDLA